MSNHKADPIDAMHPESRPQSSVTLTVKTKASDPLSPRNLGGEVLGSGKIILSVSCPDQLGE